MTSRTSVLRLAAVHHPEQLEEERCRRMPWKKRERGLRAAVSAAFLSAPESTSSSSAARPGLAAARDGGTPAHGGRGGSARVTERERERERERGGGEAGRREAVSGGRR